MLAGAFKKFGVSKIQGFSGKIYTKYELGQKYHRKCIVAVQLEICPLYGENRTDWKEPARREDIFKYGNFLFDIPLLLHF